VTSENYRKLKRYNRKASGKRKNIRAGVVVDTKRGVGIVTHRDKETIEVAHESDVLWCERYSYDIADIEPSGAEIDVESRHYRGAWGWIVGNAMHNNVSFEYDKSRAILEEHAHRVSGKTEKRTISTTFGSHEYIRFIGDGFDFEIDVSHPSISAGDKVLFALGKGDGFIVDMNGHGWFYRRKITDRDVKFGLAKYAAPQGDSE
jgi:CBS domain-containing protein